jgi:hypothetical protein
MSMTALHDLGKLLPSPARLGGHLFWHGLMELGTGSTRFAYEQLNAWYEYALQPVARPMAPRR